MPENVSNGGRKWGALVGDREKPLLEKVKTWIHKEGYPLEFRTAHIFREAGFYIGQGNYVPDDKHEKAREIDVEAAAVEMNGHAHFWISLLVECKWAKRPWVVLTDEQRGHPAFAIRQSLASKSAGAILELLAGDPELQSCSTFRQEGALGFGGREALSNSGAIDRVYSTIQGVCSNSSRFVAHWRPDADIDEHLTHGLVVFPVIVIEGRLFEAAYHAESDSIDVTEVRTSRIRWRGLYESKEPIQVDIVTIDALPEYAAARYADMQLLAKRGAEILRQLQRCYAYGSLDHLDLNYDRPIELNLQTAPEFVKEILRTADRSKSEDE